MIKMSLQGAAVVTRTRQKHQACSTSTWQEGEQTHNAHAEKGKARAGG